VKNNAEHKHVLL